MLLADLGADVLRIERPSSGAADSIDRLGANDLLLRGRRRLALDLKQPQGLATALELAARADALIEGLRPGVMERLGLGPDACLARRPALVYGRVTGWGQEGPLAPTAGHDINYLALSGALHAIGPPAAPLAPLNLLADFGGGGMLLAVGVLAALLEARQSGKGQVVDAAMTDGSALLSSMTYALRALGRWSNRRGANILDGGAPFYGTYACADGRFLAVGALEPQFHEALLEVLGLPREDFADRWNPQAWPRLRARLEAVFRTASRDEWCWRFEGSDACVTPVLDLDEAPQHPHNLARGTFRPDADGHPEPSPAPRFSRTPARGNPQVRGTQDLASILESWGIASGTG
jgi:alpha-methylacyl-CoA racemase